MKVLLLSLFSIVAVAQQQQPMKSENGNPFILIPTIIKAETQTFPDVHVRCYSEKLPDGYMFEYDYPQSTNVWATSNGDSMCWMDSQWRYCPSNIDYRVKDYNGKCIAQKPIGYRCPDATYILLQSEDKEHWCLNTQNSKQDGITLLYENK